MSAKEVSGRKLDRLRDALGIRQSCMCDDIIDAAIAALEAGAGGVVDGDVVEAAAMVIYELMPYDGRSASGVKPSWVPGGNSLKQDEARRYARAAFAAAPKASEARPFFIAEADKSPPREHNGRGGDAEQSLPPYRRPQADPAPPVAAKRFRPFKQRMKGVADNFIAGMCEDEDGDYLRVADHARMVAAKDAAEREAFQKYVDANEARIEAEQRAEALAGLAEELAGLLQDVLDSDAYDDLGRALIRRIEAALIARDGLAAQEGAG